MTLSRILAAASLLLLAISCGGSPTEPTASPAAAPGTVEGIVYHDSYLANRITIPAGPQKDARVTITEGLGAGRTFVTGADGAYRFELPAGPFRLRWSADGLETRDSETGTVRVAETTRMATVTLRLLSNVPIPEWSVSGSVVDGQGSPVAGASLLSALSTAVYASGLTDAAGNFRLTSTRQHPETLPFTIGKSGYGTAYASVTCVASCTARLDVRLLRMVRAYLDGPSSLRVGELAPVDGVWAYEDGSSDRWRPFVLQSSDASVLQVQDLTAPYEHVFVKATGPGNATLTYPGLAPLQVTVFP